MSIKHLPESLLNVKVWSLEPVICVCVCGGTTLQLPEKWRGEGDRKKTVDRNDKPVFNDKVTLPTVTLVLGKMS